MKLTAFTNFAFRVLMYTALKGDDPASIQDIAKAYGSSANHLKKAAAELVKHGYLKTVQGRYGGFLLAKSPEDINVGAVVRITEENFNLVECFGPNNQRCPLIKACQFSSLLNDALHAFLNVLDQATLADLVAYPDHLKPLLNLEKDSSYA